MSNSNKMSVKLNANQRKMIEETFVPANDEERETLQCILKEVRWIDIKPFSHNIVGLELQMLADQHGYDDKKIALVVKTFGLDKKGWMHLIKIAEDEEK